MLGGDTDIARHNIGEWIKGLKAVFTKDHGKAQEWKSWGRMSPLSIVALAITFSTRHFKTGAKHKRHIFPGSALFTQPLASQTTSI